MQFNFIFVRLCYTLSDWLSVRDAVMALLILHWRSMQMTSRISPNFMILDFLKWLYSFSLAASDHTSIFFTSIFTVSVSWLNFLIFISSLFYWSLFSCMKYWIIYFLRRICFSCHSLLFLSRVQSRNTVPDLTPTLPSLELCYLPIKVPFQNISSVPTI